MIKHTNESVVKEKLSRQMAH